MLRPLSCFVFLVLALSVQAKLGETVPQLIHRFGNTYSVESEFNGERYKFRSPNVSVDAVVAKGISVGEAYFSDHPLNSKGEPPNDIVQAILRTNVPRARWHEIRSGWGDYELQSDDNNYVAVLIYSRPQAENAIWTMVVARSDALFSTIPVTSSSSASPTPQAQPSPPTASISKQPFDAAIDWNAKNTPTPATAATETPNESFAVQKVQTKDRSIVDEITIRNAVRQPLAIIAFVATLLFYLFSLWKAFTRKRLGWKMVAVFGAILMGLGCVLAIGARQSELVLAWHSFTTKITAGASSKPPWQNYQQRLTEPGTKRSAAAFLDEKATPTTTFRGEPTKALSPAEIARRALSSVVLLTMQDERGQTRSLGSGFFVEKNIVATNYHVISQAKSGHAKIIGQPTQLNINAVVGVDTSHDLALLQLDNSTAEPLELAPAWTMSVGDAIYTIGNPYGLEGTFSQGIVSSIREVNSDRLLQITAAISPGSSGGPVLDERASVIGVAFLTLVGGQNLNFAIPAQYVGALMRNKSEPRSLASVSRAAPALFARVGGQEPRSGLVGENLTYDAPSFQAGHFSFSLRNKLKQSVANISGVVVFYDMHGEPIDIQAVGYAGVIPAGLAKRIPGRVDPSVERLNCPDKKFPYLSEPPRPPKGKVEFRIFDFSLAESADVSAPVRK